MVELPGATKLRIDLKVLPARGALRVLAAYLLWPNLVFWLIGTRIYLMRPVLNLDYLLLGALAVLLPRRLAIAMVAAEVAVDALLNVAPAFHFELGRFLLELVDVVHLNPLQVVSGAIALIACSTAVAVVGSKLAGQSLGKSQFVGLIALGVVLAGVDAMNGTSLISRGVTRSFLSFNLANSAAAKTALALYRETRDSGPGRYAPLTPADSAAGPWLAEARDASTKLRNHNLALISVESLGLPTDSKAALALLAPLMGPELRAKYTVEQGSVPFHGVTMDGEFRELCGVRLEQRGRDVPTCLPALLHARGYETFGLHGFTSQFYDRASWYPKLGFDHVLFAQELRARGLSRTCGSGFVGLCDGDVAEVAGETLRGATPGKPRLVYWMTLNSHLPLSNGDAEGSSFDCASGSSFAGDDVLCEQARVVSKALQAVAKVALDPALPPTEFVVVGDHAPPFLSRERRDAYDQQRVPFVRLVPRR